MRRFRGNSLCSCLGSSLLPLLSRAEPKTCMNPLSPSSNPTWPQWEGRGCWTQQGLGFKGAVPDIAGYFPWEIRRTAA